MIRQRVIEAMNSLSRGHQAINSANLLIHDRVVMKIIFIQPAVGKDENKDYLKSWQMESLCIAQLSALTPREIKRVFFDERLEDINFDEKADIVALTVDTFSAKRAYQIAAIFKEKGLTIIMGGKHATLCTNEVAEHADVVVAGEAEDIWKGILNDIRAGRAKKVYRSEKRANLSGYMPDRSIYGNKKYLPISLVETSRGCVFNCDFCAVTAFYKQTYKVRPVDDVITEIKTLKHKVIFFVDDNIGADSHHFKELLTKLIPLKIKWFSQISINIMQNEETLDLMRKSGCLGVLIGFESIDKKNLEQMKKDSTKTIIGYEDVLVKIRKKGIAIYATFVFGYDNDTSELLKRTLQFSIEQKFIFAAFIPLIPYPGTPLYEKLKQENRLLQDKWWLENDYYCDVAFRPKTMSPQELSTACFEMRKAFYSVKSIFKRIEFKANCRDWLSFIIFFWFNLIFRKETRQREDMPLGMVNKQNT